LLMRAPKMSGQLLNKQAGGVHPICMFKALRQVNRREFLKPLTHLR
jgi:hypothetical protein